MRIAITTGLSPHHTALVSEVYKAFGSDLVTVLRQTPSVARRRPNRLVQRLQYLRYWRAIQSTRLHKSFLASQRLLLAAADYPRELDRSVSDINNSDTIDWLTERRPDILVVFGGRLIKSHVINLVPAAFTVHLGWVPDYKGSQCIMWPIYNEEYAKIGVSLLNLEVGADTGGIIARSRIVIKAGDNEYALLARARATAVEMTVAELRHFTQNGALTIAEKNVGGRLYRAREFGPEVRHTVRRNIGRYIRQLR